MVKARGEFTVAPLSDGSDGRGVVSVTTYFLATSLSTGVTTKTSGWGTALQPLTATKRYLWEYTVTAYDSGSPTTTIPVIKGVYGDKGDDGVSITSMVEEYYHSTSPTTQTGGSWSTIVPDWAGDKYLWLRIKTVYSNSTVTHTKAMNVTGQKGETGSQGKDKFLWIKYADDEKGSGMSDSGIDKKYIGVSPNQLSEKESDNPSDYKWSPMYDLGALDDITLADKTEILSGTEIYTDKADDSVVHVDIDGKSYQNAGSGKNLFNLYTIPKTVMSSLLLTNITTNGFTVESTNTTSWQNIRWDISYALLPDKTYTIKLPFSILSGDISDTYGEVFLDGSFLGTMRKVTDGFILTFSTTGLVKGQSKLEFRLNINGISNVSIKKIKFYNIQLEEGSVATPYEPPAPTPDYPIEIESLNDFDVVSSVGGRNLFIDGSKIVKTKRFAEFSVHKALAGLVGKRVTISFDAKLNEDGIERKLQAYYYQTSGLSIEDTYYFNPTKEWKRFSYVGTVRENPIPSGYTKGSIGFYDMIGENDYSIRNFKISDDLEKTWIPSPNDISFDTKS